MPDPVDPLADRSDVLPRPPLRRGWRDRLDQLADATGTTPVRILGGFAALAVALGVGLWLTRPAAPPPEVSLPFTSSVVATSALPSSTTSTAPPSVVVDVAGAVVHPGVLTLDAGARVVDAIAAAGGLRPDADGARLNLAAPLADGQRVYVPVVGEQPPGVVDPIGPGTGTGGDGAAPVEPVNLNTADQPELEQLPGIGPATAAAIIEHRQRIGRFTSVDQLLDVRGIGEAKLEQLRPYVTV